MANRYDARAHIYIVSSPQELRKAGVLIRAAARQAALKRGSWAGSAVA
jgi:hypothetical protein